MMKLAAAIRALRPDVSFSLEGEVEQWNEDNILQNVTFLTPDTAPITKTEYETFLETWDWVDPTPKEYQKRRMDSYPPLTDFVDAYYHEKNGDASKMTAYWEKVDAVKAQFPKV